jgi:hypothetical protein
MVPLLFSILVAINQPSEPPRLGKTAQILSTVEHSEWCPAGRVALDVRTGRFDFTARASRRICNETNLERPVRKGKLSPGDLDAVRAAYLKALTEGLESTVCRNGARPQEIWITNGGVPILVLASGAWTVSAPDDLTCWSQSARELQDLLDRLFRPFQPRG